MTKNYFQGSEESPYHISVGAVVKNNEGKICCHYFEKSVHGHPNFTNFYLLMRETMELNETIEQCLHRGLQEEFGIEAKIVQYLGSIVSHFPKKNVTVEKTTIYFLCDFISIDESRRKEGDPEASSEIKWLTKEDLIPKMKEQGTRFNRDDADESSILERLIK